MTSPQTQVVWVKICDLGITTKSNYHFFLCREKKETLIPSIMKSTAKNLGKSVGSQVLQNGMSRMLTGEYFQRNYKLKSFYSLCSLHNTMLVWYILLSCDCLFVGLPLAGTVTKWLHFRFQKQCRTIARGLWCSLPAKDLHDIPVTSPPMWAPNTGGVG